MAGEPITLPSFEPLADRLRAYDGLALLLDFDGTLAPIVDEPDAAEIRPEARGCLRELAAGERVDVAVVSGRAAADVRDRVGVDGVRYVGNHGMEHAADGEVTNLADSEVLEAVEAACDRLDARLAGVEDAVVERKGPTATVHFRRVEAERVPGVEAAVREVVEESDRLAAVEGRSVLEVRPADGPDKGDAAVRLVEEVVPAGENWLPTFVGDDVGDEPAFAAVEERGGVGVVVGRTGPTAASHRVPDSRTVCEFLAWVVESGRPVLGESPGRRAKDGGPSSG